MLRELPSLSLNLIINTPVNLSVSESDTWWLRAQPSSWAKSGSFGPPPCIQGNRCKRLNSELGAQTALHLSVSKGVIQRKRESRSSATSSSNDNSRPGPMAQAVHTGMKYVLFT